MVLRRKVNDEQTMGIRPDPVRQQNILWATVTQY